MIGDAAWFESAIAILATWRVAHLIAHEDGPFDVVVGLRARAGVGLLGRLMDCPYCLSLWVAAPLALWIDGATLRAIVLWLAISGGSCAIEKLVAARDPAPPSAGPPG